jgi:hypothetical protein
MLKAKDFVDICPAQFGEEYARLQAIHANIAEQPFEVKQQLSTEFLEIIEDRNEKLQSRIIACNMLGGYCSELMIDAKRVSKRLRKVLAREFLIFKNIGFGFRHYRSDRILLRENISPVELAFLQIILATILRIDYKESHGLVKLISAKMDNADLNESMMKLLAVEKEKWESRSGES